MKQLFDPEGWHWGWQSSVSSLVTWTMK